MNYLKISGQLVCKMLVLLAFVFAACSEDRVSGGVTEETRVYALSGRVGDVYPKMLKATDDGISMDSSGYEGSVFARKGTIVTVYELDSLTLDTTGRFFADTVDNDSGYFAFENLTLNSPYVLIETLDSCYRGCVENGVFDLLYGTVDSTLEKKSRQVYNAVVDLRHMKNVGVSLLTTAKIPLLRQYFAEGKSFAEASKIAERTFLENLGIYEDLGDFEELVGENSELPYVSLLARWSDWAIGFDINFYSSFVFALQSSSFWSFSTTAEQLYMTTFVKLLNYEIGYAARRDSLGQCTESRENETGKIRAYGGNIFDVVCRSGKWIIGFKTIEHTNGTMVDARDGKTYKTVTYDFGGVPQTWMAENLDFVDTVSLSVDSALKANLKGSVSCYRDTDDEKCRIWGHGYQWRAAMNIGYDDIKVYSIGTQGDSLLMSRRCRDAYLVKESDYEFPDDIKAVRDSCNTIGEYYLDDEGSQRRTWNYADYITPTNQKSYQGICPDGWRIPTSEDWKILLQNLGEQYGVDSGDVILALYDRMATGFGLEAMAFVEGVETSRMSRFLSYSNYFVIADVSIYTADFFDSEGGPMEGLNLDEWHWHSFLEELRWGDLYPGEFKYRLMRNPYKSAAVRCIKN